MNDKNDNPRQRPYHTRVRGLLLDFLAQNAHSTVTAAEVLAYFQSQNQPVNRATVYRNLDRLVEERAVIKYVSDDGKKASYLYCGPHENCQEHLHLQCSACGRVIHLDCGLADQLTAHLRDSHGFDLKCGSSILYGLCEDCRKNKR